MDKKNVQFQKPWIFYGKVVDCEHNEKLASDRKKNKFYFVTIIFIFFCENNLSIIYVDNIWQQLTTKLCQNYAPNFHVRFVIIIRVKKAAMIIILRARSIKSTFWQHLATKLCQNYAPKNIPVKIVEKNTTKEPDYGDIKRNV